MSKKRGIYLVANLKSQSLCENLIYSIRRSGCQLPIRLIHYGGQPIDSTYVQQEAQVMQPSDFPEAGHRLVGELQTLLTSCPNGFLNRFLAWFGDWDEFIYSDNDIVALMNWEKLFDFLPGHQLVHADEEYRTQGRYNYFKPQEARTLLGPDALDKAFTAGHFVSVKDDTILAGIRQAIEWFHEHPNVPKRHDQSLLSVALVLGGWQVLNLCKSPHRWLTTWAGDYPHPLGLIQSIQQNGSERLISHLHYSGRLPNGELPLDELLLSNLSHMERLKRVFVSGFRGLLRIEKIRFHQKRIKRHITLYFSNAKVISRLHALRGALSLRRGRVG